MIECFNTLYKVTDNVGKEYFITVGFFKIEMVFEKFKEIRNNERTNIVDIVFMCHDVITTVK